MTSVADPDRVVVGGVDTHKDEHVAAVIDDERAARDGRLAAAVADAAPGGKRATRDRERLLECCERHASTVGRPASSHKTLLRTWPLRPCPRQPRRSRRSGTTSSGCG